MNCENFETVVNDLARHQIMEANVREQALIHSGTCEACALRLRDERMLTFGLRALATEMKSLEAPYRVEEQLLAAFRSRSVSHRLPSRSTSRWSYLLTAAAAVLLIVFGIAAMRWRLEWPSKNEPKTNETVKAETPSEESTPVTERSTAGSPPRQKSVLASRPRRATSAQRAVTHSSNRDRRSSLDSGTVATATANFKESEVATEFMSLGYVSPVNLQDGGQIVRVELPRSAMVSLGLPVNMDRYSERVKADVLVGVDGLARAIRFVQ